MPFKPRSELLTQSFCNIVFPYNNTTSFKNQAFCLSFRHSCILQTSSNSLVNHRFLHALRQWQSNMNYSPPVTPEMTSLSELLVSDLFLRSGATSPVTAQTSPSSSPPPEKATSLYPLYFLEDNVDFSQSGNNHMSLDCHHKPSHTYQAIEMSTEKPDSHAAEKQNSIYEAIHTVVAESTQKSPVQQYSIIPIVEHSRASSHRIPHPFPPDYVPPQFAFGTNFEYEKYNLWRCLCQDYGDKFSYEQLIHDFQLLWWYRWGRSCAVVYHFVIPWVS